MAQAPTKKMSDFTAVAGEVSMPEPTVRELPAIPFKGEGTVTEIKGVTHIVMAG